MAEGATVIRVGLALQLQPFGGAVRLVELAENAAGKLGARWGGRRGARYLPAVMMAEVSVVLFFCVRNGREEGRVLAWV